MSVAINFDQIKDVDNYTKLIVNGYIHGVTTSNPTKVIPPLITYVIIAYFYNPEYFARQGSNILVNDKKDTAKCERRQDADDDDFDDISGSIFGNIKITPNMHCNRFVWTFKVSNASTGVVLGIGIDASTNKCLDSLFDSDYKWLIF